MTRKAAVTLSASLPAFYARPGNLRGDLIALLHAPYTAWHLSYVVFGAVLATELDWMLLAGTLAAFFLGTGVAAHALDEWHGRPLRTTIDGRMLLALGAAGFVAALALGTAAAVAISPWALAWAAAGVLLAAGYALEWDRRLHSDLGFALAWGGFPVLVGYWAQTERLGIAVAFVAGAATLLSLAQRALSTPARYTRRSALDAEVVLERYEGAESWPRERLLATWEWPLKLLAAAVVVLALGLLAARM